MKERPRIGLFRRSSGHGCRGDWPPRRVLETPWRSRPRRRRYGPRTGTSRPTCRCRLFARGRPRSAPRRRPRRSEAERREGRHDRYSQLVSRSKNPHIIHPSMLVLGTRLLRNRGPTMSAFIALARRTRNNSSFRPGCSDPPSTSQACHPIARSNTNLTKEFNCLQRSARSLPDCRRKPLELICPQCKSTLLAWFRPGRRTLGWRTLVWRTLVWRTLQRPRLFELFRPGPAHSPTRPS